MQTAIKNNARHGSAMIFVVIVTVLLAVVGVMFVMVARVGEMQTSAVIDSGDLSTAVESVVGRIHTVLVEDLFGTDGLMLSADADPLKPGADEREDYPSHKLNTKTGNWDDPIAPGANGVINPNQVVGNDDIWRPGTQDDIWLASLEPVLDDNGTPANTADDYWRWPRITDLWGTLQGRPDSLYYQRNSLNDHAAIYAANALRKQWIDPDDTTVNPTNATFGWNTAALWNKWEVSAKDVRAKVIVPGERTQTVAVGTEIDADVKAGTQTFPNPWKDAAWVSPFGARADADGDGVADSRWVKVPNLTTSRGKPVFAAVRIIDNCAMLNLNTAYCFYQTPYTTTPNSPFTKFWHENKLAHDNGIAYHGTVFSSSNPYGNGGRYLTEINYLSFLRGSDLSVFFGGGDGWYNISAAKKFSWVNGAAIALITPQQAHAAVMKIEESTLHPVILPATYFSFFDIGDELELRNRFLLTSKAEARFEQKTVANYTLDSGSTDYAALKVPRDQNNPISIWYERMNPANFNRWDATGTVVAAGTVPYKYDRRHISTFYSFDRPLRSGKYASLETALAAELALLKSNAALTDAQRLAKLRAIESVFRPLDSRPLDLRTMTDPANPDRITANTVGARKNILHLLYAFRAFYTEKGLARAEAAKKSAQIVANLIDYLDADTATATGPFGDAIYGSQINANPTYINRSMVQQLILEVSGALPAPNNTPIDIGAAVLTPPSPYEFGLGVTDATETVYGYERQPFISEIYCYRNPVTGTVEAFGLEFVNPYPNPISLNGWQIIIGTQPPANLTAAYSVPAATGTTPANFGRLTMWAANAGYTVPYVGSNAQHPGFGLGTQFNNAIITLYRPDTANAGQYMATDMTRLAQTTSIFNNTGIRVSKRDDADWKFTNNFAYALVDTTATLGQANNIPANAVTQKGYQLPVANAGGPIYTLGDFVKVAFVSNEKGGAAPKTITEQIADAADESGIRYDAAVSPKLLDYICFLNRPEKGSLPGRININTAAKHVIAAAIPPQLVMSKVNDPNNALFFAEQIVANRPYQRVSDLLTKVPAFQKYKTDSVDVGDQLIRGDFEERDWILSRLSNIFTVRSDVFTAYILVRLGEDGPERRMMAIFDRSQCWTPTDRPKLVALHPVPDPR